MNLRSPLAQVLGLGSAREGVSHWWWQRLTAVALVPLALWFIWSLFDIGSLSYANVHAWLALPSHALVVALFVGILALHSQLGVQVVIEDYVHDHALKAISLIASNLAHVLVGAAGVLGVLLVTLRGSA
jgi:succinate dehydrogenase / fumarate reductase membrane anchor subunit